MKSDVKTFNVNVAGSRIEILGVCLEDKKIISGIIGNLAKKTFYKKGSLTIYTKDPVGLVLEMGEIIPGMQFYLPSDIETSDYFTT